MSLQFIFKSLSLQYKLSVLPLPLYWQNPRFNFLRNIKFSHLNQIYLKLNCFVKFTYWNFHTKTNECLGLGLTKVISVLILNWRFLLMLSVPFCKNKNNPNIESVSKLKILLIIIDYWK